MTPKELLENILHHCSENKFPDIHLNSWFQPKVRNRDGDIMDIWEIKIWETFHSLPVLTKESIEKNNRSNCLKNMIGKIWAWNGIRYKLCIIRRR